MNLIFFLASTHSLQSPDWDRINLMDTINKFNIIPSTSLPFLRIHRGSIKSNCHNYLPSQLTQFIINFHLTAWIKSTGSFHQTSSHSSVTQPDRRPMLHALQKQSMTWIIAWRPSNVYTSPVLWALQYTLNWCGDHHSGWYKKYFTCSASASFPATLNLLFTDTEKRLSQHHLDKSPVS